jgi:sorting nexin-1/2
MVEGEVEDPRVHKFTV